MFMYTHMTVILAFMAPVAIAAVHRMELHGQGAETKQPHKVSLAI